MLVEGHKHCVEIGATGGLLMTAPCTMVEIGRFLKGSGRCFVSFVSAVFYKAFRPLV